MGNTIIRASHVGKACHRVSAYYGTLTDEDIAIAKRAAILTKNRWAEERRNKEKKLSNTANGDINTQSVHLNGNIRTEDTQSRHRKPKANRKPAVPCLVISPSPAQKLGITDVEFLRRVSALRKHRWGIS